MILAVKYENCNKEFKDYVNSDIVIGIKAGQEQGMNQSVPKSIEQGN